MPDPENRKAGERPERPDAPHRDSVLSGVFSFDPADSIYTDHFPGCPVVPGSVVISAFLKAGRTAVPERTPGRIQDFKFRAFLTPGAYPFRLEAAGNLLMCRLWRPGAETRRPLVTGTILCQGAE